MTSQFAIFDINSQDLLHIDATKSACVQWLQSNPQEGRTLSIRKVVAELPHDFVTSDLDALLRATWKRREPWTQEEMNTIMRHHQHTESWLQQHYLPHRPVHQIKHRLLACREQMRIDKECALYEFEHELKHEWGKVHRRPYSKREDELIIRYRLLGAEAISTILRGRTPSSINNRITVLDAKGLIAGDVLQAVFTDTAFRNYQSNM